MELDEVRAYEQAKLAEKVVALSAREQVLEEIVIEKFHQEKLIEQLEEKNSEIISLKLSLDTKMEEMLNLEVELKRLQMSTSPENVNVDASICKMNIAQIATELAANSTGPDLNNVSIDECYAENPLWSPSKAKEHRTKATPPSTPESVLKNRNKTSVKSLNCFAQPTPVARRSSWLDCGEQSNENSVSAFTFSQPADDSEMDLPFPVSSLLTETIARETDGPTVAATSSSHSILEEDNRDTKRITLSKSLPSDKWGMIVQVKVKNDGTKQARITNIAEGGISFGALEIRDVILSVNGLDPVKQFISSKDLSMYMSKEMQLNMLVRRPLSLSSPRQSSQQFGNPSLRQSLRENHPSTSIVRKSRSVSPVRSGIRQPQQRIGLERSVSSDVPSFSTMPVPSFDSLQDAFASPSSAYPSTDQLNEVGLESSKKFVSGIVKFLVEEGMVADEQTEHSISASEIEKLLRREADISKREKELFRSVICIFLAIAISVFICSM
jgi:hypothetical protein